MLLQPHIDQLINAICADYARWSGNLTSPRQEMIDEFNKSIHVKIGKKYIKIIRDRSVWGFIVKETSGKFREGDILKAAGWNAPATNSARGNILDGGYTVQWTGPLYLR